jgi:hypothetical protein
MCYNVWASLGETRDDVGFLLEGDPHGGQDEENGSRVERITCAHPLVRSPVKDFQGVMGRKTNESCKKENM